MLKSKYAFLSCIIIEIKISLRLHYANNLTFATNCFALIKLKWNSCFWRLKYGAHIEPLIKLILISYFKWFNGIWSSTLQNKGSKDERMCMCVWQIHTHTHIQVVKMHMCMQNNNIAYGWKWRVPSVFYEVSNTFEWNRWKPRSKKMLCIWLSF